MLNTERVFINGDLGNANQFCFEDINDFTMFDTAHVETAEEMISRANDVPDLVDLCENYFEISIGVRRPTEAEKSDALSNLMGAFHESKPAPEERVKAMMRPLASTPAVIRMVLVHEYIVYQILSRETEIVEQPYIPMLRYETRMQDELQEERRYNEAIIRQAALFQTYLRMTQNNFSLNWADCLYHGNDKITPPRLSGNAKDRIKDVYSFRSDIGHDWRVYVEPSTNQSQLQIYAKGRWVLDELLNTELNETYENYTSNPPSHRLLLGFGDRGRATATVTTPKPTITRSCPECGEEIEDDPNSCSNCGWESDNPIDL